MPSIWTETFRVRSYETDPDGYASLQTLCNYLQEAAGLHARSFGAAIDDLLADGKTWVLARLRVTVDRYPGWGDVVDVETWPSGQNGLFATRDFLIYSTPREGGDRILIGRGISAWLVVDVARKRPVRIPAPIQALRLPERTRALDEGFDRLAPLEPYTSERRFHVRFSDLDVNQHVNNVRYAEWAVESVPETHWRTRRPCAMELHFQAETNVGDLVVARAAPEDADTFRHHLVREADGQTVALARTRWVRREERRAKSEEGDKEAQGLEIPGPP